MHAEIIAIGDELTSGQRLDTNSRWLSQQLGDLGIQTVRHTTIGDSLSDNVEALQRAVARAEVVVCTGGLGPTLDDLTRQAMADAFQLPLELDQESLNKIVAMFASRNREMPENNRVQAMFPQGSQIVPNPHGSAPGIDLQVAALQPARTGESPGIANRSCRVFALPGVPAEMRQMWLETVAPRLELLLGSQLGRLHYHAVKVFGIGESDVEVKLPQLIARQRTPTVGITVSRATITLRVAGRATDAAAFQHQIAPTLGEIESALGDLVFGAGDDELEHVVARNLKQQGQTLACVEVGAASWISDWLLKVDEPQCRCFAGGVAFPNRSAAERWLEREPAAESLAVTSGCGEMENASETLEDERWTAIARLAAERFGAELALVVGVYPSVKEMECTNGTFDFVFALATSTNVLLERRAMGGHPDVLGPRVAKTGLDIVRRYLANEGLANNGLANDG